MAAPRHPPRRFAPADAVALLSLVLLPLALLFRFLTGREVLFYRDIALVFGPQIAWARASLADGQLPLWNPLLAGGFPQWASMEPAFLYPPNALFGLPSYPWALAAQIFLHLALAGCGTYALGRALGWRRPAALVAAYGYALGGFMVSLNSLYTSLQFAALLPLVTLTFHRLCVRGTGRDWLWAAAALALQTATNRPDFTLMTLLFLGVYGACTAGRAALPRLAGIGLLALAANAATALPAAEFILNSDRRASLATEAITYFSLPPAALMQVLCPWALGDPQQNADWGRFFVGDPGGEFAVLYPSLYPGAAALLLAGLGLARGPRRLAWGLGGLAAFAALMALGRFGFLFEWVHTLPVLSLVRHPAKYALLWTWPLALLAGMGADAWLTRPAATRGYFLRAGAGAGLGLVAVAALWATSGAWAGRLAAVDWAAWTAGPINEAQRAHLARAMPAAAPAALAGLSVLLSLLVALSALAARRGRLAGRSFLAVVILDVFAHAWPLLYGAAPDFYAPPPAVAVVREHAQPGELFRLQATLDTGGADLAAVLPGRYPAARSWAEVLSRWSREALASLAPLEYGLAGVQASTSGLNPARSVRFLLDDLGAYAAIHREAAPPEVLAGLLNVRYFQYAQAPGAATPDPRPVAARSLLRPLYAAQSAGLRLYEHAGWRPRAFISTEAVLAPGLREAFLALAGPGDWRRRVVITADERWEATRPLRESRRGTIPGITPSLIIADYDNQLVRLQLDSPESGFLVLSDNDYPGWEAIVDDEPRPILSAYGVVRAVWVEPGRHEVVFRYRPWSWMLGVLLTLATLLLGLGRIALARSARRGYRLEAKGAR